MIASTPPGRHCASWISSISGVSQQTPRIPASPVVSSLRGPSALLPIMNSCRLRTLSSTSRQNSAYPRCLLFSIPRCDTSLHTVLSAPCAIASSLSAPTPLSVARRKPPFALVSPHPIISTRIPYIHAHARLVSIYRSLRPPTRRARCTVVVHSSPTTSSHASLVGTPSIRPTSTAHARTFAAETAPASVLMSFPGRREPHVYHLRLLLCTLR